MRGDVSADGRASGQREKTLAIEHYGASLAHPDCAGSLHFFERAA
jgi:hypothetical protein